MAQYCHRVNKKDRTNNTDEISKKDIQYFIAVGAKTSLTKMSKILTKD